MRYLSVLCCLLTFLCLTSSNQDTANLAVISSQVESNSSSNSNASTKNKVKLRIFTDGKVKFHLPSHYTKKYDGHYVISKNYYTQMNKLDKDDYFTIKISSKDPSFNKTSESSFIKNNDYRFSSFQLKDFKPVVISGYPAFRITYSRAYKSRTANVVEFIVDAKYKTYTFTYNTINGKLIDSVDRCANNIEIKD